MKNNKTKNKFDEVVIFDIDGTILKGQSQKHFIDYLFKLKIISLFFYIKILIWFFLYKLNLIKDPKKIAEYSFKKILENKKEGYVNDVTKKFFTEKLIHFFYKDALNLINLHKKEGQRIVLVSNTIDIIVKEVAEYLGVSEYLCTNLEKNKNIYTGKIKGEINYGENKAKNIKKYFEKNKLFFSKSWGYGDHFSDIYMLKLVKYPFVINPNKKLRKEAGIKKWNILIFKEIV